jgi:hypothetical protein
MPVGLRTVVSLSSAVVIFIQNVHSGDFETHTHTHTHHSVWCYDRIVCDYLAETSVRVHDGSCMQRYGGTALLFNEDSCMAFEECRYILHNLIPTFTKSVKR